MIFTWENTNKIASILSIIGFIIALVTLWQTYIVIPDLLEEKRKNMFVLDAKYDNIKLIRNKSNTIKGSYFNDIQCDEKAYAVASISGKYYIQPTFVKYGNPRWTVNITPDHEYEEIDLIICIAKGDGLNKMEEWKMKADKKDQERERKELPDQVRHNSLFEFKIQDKE